ncbi:peptidoglycan-binding protein [Novosphingobium barchaimii LL02]|uniref:Peptidoglycan-binding protein n=1 Tax=Novosphingobium barchaimii LL02 TaxID=1114963 RepID=A0A0J7XXY9_9SPHN|nr:FecR domain-containing protein [Novosphingobium barchaimii]KMS56404.1 peptidoglycan-binding protein [Novosphingobium barchaimii LL02]
MTAAALILLAVISGPAANAETRTVLNPARQTSGKASGETVRYKVQRGDNLFRLAALYLIRPDDYRTVQRLNRVADPLRLPIGMILLIPRELLKLEPVRGAVHSYSGAVRIGGRPATVGMGVSEGTLIETGQKSFVTLRLPDDSSIALPSQSAVRIQRLRRSVLGNHLERLFEIERGRASATVTPMSDPLSDFRFATPGAITSVRGTRFRMSYDTKGGQATSEVLEGKVGFAAEAHDAQTLPAGFGTTSELPAPVALLDAPQLAGADGVQSSDDVRFALQSVPGAKAYRLQIGADAAFLSVLDEVLTVEPEAHFASLPDGIYFVRATAIDGNDLEGKPGITRFERRLDRIGMGLEVTPAGYSRQFRFWWRAYGAVNPQFRFQLAKAGKEAKPMIEQGPLSGNDLIVIDLPPGSYRWRVMTSQVISAQTVSRWSDYSDLRVESGW